MGIQPWMSIYKICFTLTKLKVFGRTSKENSNRCPWGKWRASCLWKQDKSTFPTQPPLHKHLNNTNAELMKSSLYSWIGNRLHCNPHQSRSITVWDVINEFVESIPVCMRHRLITHSGRWNLLSATHYYPKSSISSTPNHADTLQMRWREGKDAKKEPQRCTLPLPNCTAAMSIMKALLLFFLRLAKNL